MFAGNQMQSPSGMSPFFKYNTFSLALSKSSLVTFMRLSLRAIRPASVHMALMSAPERSSLVAISSVTLTSGLRLILAVWIWKILCLVLRSGTGNSIFLSILPGRMSAGSRLSILLVAMMTFTSAWVSNPSNWFSSQSIVRWTSFSPPELESYLLVPIASIQSMKMIEGACSWAVLNNSLTNLGPSPKYFWISSDPTTLKNVAEVQLATALASRVLPVPGSPQRMTPFGGLMPMSSQISG